MNEEISKIVAAAVLTEREACAKVCDDKHHEWRYGNGDDATSGPKECAELIRERQGTWLPVSLPAKADLSSSPRRCVLPDECVPSPGLPARTPHPHAALMAIAVLSPWAFIYLLCRAIGA